MSNIEALIQEIGFKGWTATGETEKVYVGDVIDIIRKHAKGMVLVPAEPTHDMIEAGLHSVLQNARSSDQLIIGSWYKAMLSASQQGGEE